MNKPRFPRLLLTDYRIIASDNLAPTPQNLPRPDVSELFDSLTGWEVFDWDIVMSEGPQPDERVAYSYVIYARLLEAENGPRSSFTPCEVPPNTKFPRPIAEAQTTSLFLSDPPAPEKIDRPLVEQLFLTGDVADWLVIDWLVLESHMTSEPNGQLRYNYSIRARLTQRVA